MKLPDAMQEFKLSIIPVFNERDTIRQILEVVRATPYHKEINICPPCHREFCNLPRRSNLSKN